MAIEKNNKRITNAWTMYDWANSVFSLTIATAIFPPYFESVSKVASINQNLHIGDTYYLNFFGYKVVNTALYSYALSFGFLLVAVFSPILSGIADVKQNKKAFMKMFCYLGSFSCLLMYFFTPNTIYIGLILFVISLVGFAGSIVFYNAFLPEIATEDQLDKLSARGFSMGYIGSVILLIANLITIMFPEMFFSVEHKALELQKIGIEPVEAFKQAKDYYAGIASRLSFVSVGLWWAGFAQITFKNVPEIKLKKEGSSQLISKGINELKNVFKEINLPQNHKIKRYLWGFFFTSMGLQTIMYVASLFGSEELKLPTQDLIITILIIQIIAIGGAWIFSRLSAKIGNIYTLIITILIWIGICIMAYNLTTKFQFYALGGIVGFVMGGIQSMFRSTYAKLIPDDALNHTSYFSFYDFSEKIAIVLGTIVFGVLIDITGNMRSSVLALTLFFIFGLFFISRIKNFKEVHP